MLGCGDAGMWVWEEVMWVWEEVMWVWGVVMWVVGRGECGGAGGGEEHWVKLGLSQGLHCILGALSVACCCSAQHLLIFPTCSPCPP